MENTRVITRYNHDRTVNGWQFQITASATGRVIHTSDAVYRSRNEAAHFGGIFDAQVRAIVDGPRSSLADLI